MKLLPSLTAGALAVATLSIAAVIDAAEPARLVQKTATATIELTKDGKKVTEKLSLGLFSDKLPITTANFENLCKNGLYNDSIFHRNIKGFMIQGGDYENKNGTGGKAFNGGKFDDEGFPYEHKKHVLSMANAGPNTNGSQFFITYKVQSHLDGRHVVFGCVKPESNDTMWKLENAPTGRGDRPVPDIKFVSCKMDATPAFTDCDTAPSTAGNEL